MTRVVFPTFSVSNSPAGMIQVKTAAKMVSINKRAQVLGISNLNFFFFSILKLLKRYYFILRLCGCGAFALSAPQSFYFRKSLVNCTSTDAPAIRQLSSKTFLEL